LTPRFGRIETFWKECDQGSISHFTQKTNSINYTPIQVEKSWSIGRTALASEYYRERHNLHTSLTFGWTVSQMLGVSGDISLGRDVDTFERTLTGKDFLDRRTVSFNLYDNQQSYCFQKRTKHIPGLDSLHNLMSVEDLYIETDRYEVRITNYPKLTFILTQNKYRQNNTANYSSFYMKSFRILFL